MSVSARAASSASATTSGQRVGATQSRAGGIALARAHPRRPAQFAAPSSSPSTKHQTLRPQLEARAASDAAAAPLTAPKPPAGVTLPPRQPDVPEPRFGFVDWAEKINGRACMMGFFALLLVEGITHKGLFELAGFTVGQGLGFEL
jgi:hypothetical protein